MIHFQCGCGRTLSAREDERGGARVCGGCGAEVLVPNGAVGAAAVERTAARRNLHDFDAEIVGASRTRPPRPVKTPERLESGAADEEATAAASPPGYDLERVRQAPRLIGFVSWFALAVVAAASVAVFLLWPVRLELRCVVAIGLLVLAATVFVGLQLLKDLSRAVAGLAERQREILARITDEEG